MDQTVNERENKGNNFFSNFLGTLFSGGKNNSENGQETGQKKTKLIFKRILYGVLSLLFATFLWGYVLMNQNPDREKTFTDITPSFESGAEADLVARKLTPYGDITQILKHVSVTVSAPLTEISKIRANNITATVSLNDVHAAGTYSLEVKATSTVGTVVSIEPDHIEITVDDVVSRSVPVKYQFIGELPEAYWHDEPVLSAANTVLEGARTDIENVSCAVCYIELTGVTSSVNRSIPLAVLDNNDNRLDGSMFKNIIPAVNVSMTVLPHKHVSIFYDITDRDQLADIYEIQSETLSVTSLDIAAEPDVLAQIDYISAAPVSIGGIDDIGEYKFTLALLNIPAGARIIDGVDRNNIQLTINVVDRFIYQTIEDMPIIFLNESPEYTYKYEFETVDVTIYGPAKHIVGFVSSDIVVSVNLMHRGLGEYVLPIEYKPIDVDSFGGIEVTFSHDTMHVSIGKRPSVQ